MNKRSRYLIIVNYLTSAGSLYDFWLINEGLWSLSREEESLDGSFLCLDLSLDLDCLLESRMISFNCFYEYFRRADLLAIKPLLGTNDLMLKTFQSNQNSIKLWVNSTFNQITDSPMTTRLLLLTLLRSVHPRHIWLFLDLDGDRDCWSGVDHVGGGGVRRWRKVIIKLWLGNTQLEPLGTASHVTQLCKLTQEVTVWHTVWCCYFRGVKFRLLAPLLWYYGQQAGLENIFVWTPLQDTIDALLLTPDTKIRQQT